MTKHTPGPWKPWMTGFDNQSFAIGPNGKTPIAKTLGGNKETNEANARLIAAAPDLLEALKECAAWFELDKHRQNPVFASASSIGVQMVLNAKAAIAKAEGRAL